MICGFVTCEINFFWCTYAYVMMKLIKSDFFLYLRMSADLYLNNISESVDSMSVCLSVLSIGSLIAGQIKKYYC